MIAGMILAAGEGTRIKSKDKNKVTLPFLNRPMILYGVELLLHFVDPLIVVIGAFHESVKKVLKDYPIVYAYQRERLGTGHAVKVGLDVFKKRRDLPSMVIVAYGDHTMFYKKKTVQELIKLQTAENPAISLVSTAYENPNSLAWGRIVRDDKGNIIDSVEQKDANDKQKMIKELNAGFYCFDFQFLRENIEKLKKSPITGEYYINALIKVAVDQGKKVEGLRVPFSGVGLGINRYDELKESQKLYLNSRKK